MEYIHENLMPVIFSQDNPNISCILNLPPKWQKDREIVNLLTTLDENLKKMSTPTRTDILKMYHEVNIDTVITILPKLTQKLLDVFITDPDRRHKLVDLREFLYIMLFPVRVYEQGIFENLVLKINKSLRLVNLQGTPIKDSIKLSISDIL